MEISIHKMKDEEWPDVKYIYQEGIATGDATFESEAPDWEQWDKSHLDSFRGRGIGTELLKAAIEESQRAGIWTLQSGTFPENAASIAIQKACGFREVGIREKIGCMNGQWRDVILMERRSKVVGI